MRRFKWGRTGATLFLLALFNFGCGDSSEQGPHVDAGGHDVPADVNLGAPAFTATAPANEAMQALGVASYTFENFGAQLVSTIQLHDADGAIVGVVNISPQQGGNTSYTKVAEFDLTMGEHQAKAVVSTGNSASTVTREFIYQASGETLHMWTSADSDTQTLFRLLRNQASLSCVGHQIADDVQSWRNSREARIWLA